MEEIEIVEKEGKKYIDGEEILCEYDCWTNWIIFRPLIIIFALYATYTQGYTNQEKHLVATIILIFLFMLMFFWLARDIKNIINRGIYITQNNIITFSGKKINLEDIYYGWRGGGGEMGSIAFFLYFHKKLIIYCPVGDDDLYRKMISTLQKVSNNSLKSNSLNDKNRKLIVGEKNARK